MNSTDIIALHPNVCKLILYIAAEGGEINISTRRLAAVLGMTHKEVRNAIKGTSRAQVGAQKRGVVTLSLSADWIAFLKVVGAQFGHTIVGDMGHSGKEKEKQEKESFPPHPLYKEKEYKEKESSEESQNKFCLSSSHRACARENTAPAIVDFNSLIRDMKGDSYWVAQMMRDHHFNDIDLALEKFRQHIMRYGLAEKLTPNVQKMRAWFARAASVFLTDNIELGAGEYIKDGRRFYNVGRMTKSVPAGAPPRPSFSYGWHTPSQSWKYNPDY